MSWKGERKRHSLSSRGIKTGNRKVRTPNPPKPLFVGRTEGTNITHHFPDAESAQRWHNEDPEHHHLRAISTQRDLQKQDKEPELDIEVRPAKYHEIEDEDIPEWKAIKD